MSIHSSNYINSNYNIDKLNYSKIKKELESIPKIIKNHNKIRPCLSMTDLYNYDQINSSNNLNLNDNLYLKNSNNFPTKNILSQKSLSYKKGTYNIYKNNLYERNDTNNSFNEDIIIKIKKENNKKINNIKNLYERKIKEITLFYENKFINLNNLLKDNLNQYKLLASDYISISKHKNIINELKQNYNELLNKTKENYEKLIYKLTDIMKNKTKYQDLIQRLQLYTIYEVEINEIEKKLVNSLNEKISAKLNEKNKGDIYYFNDFYLLSQLDEDINYHKKICEIKQLYQEKLTELKNNNNKEINNLINQVKYIYENYSQFSSNKFLNNNIIINKNKDLNNDAKLKCSINMKENKKEIIDFSEYKENECKSISNSRSSENINQNSSKELANLLNIDTSNENHLKPEIMEINFKKNH